MHLLRPATWSQSFAVVAAMFALLALVGATAFRAHFSSQEALVQFITDSGGVVYFADEQIDDGSYNKVVRVFPGPMPPVPPIASRVIHEIHFPIDNAPRWIWLAIAHCRSLRHITVTPPVYRSASFKIVRDNLSSERIRVRWYPRHAPVQTVKNATEYAEARSVDSLVLFLDTPASLDAAVSRSRFCELADTVSKTSPQIRFVRIDFADDVFTPFWNQMNEWFESQNIPTLGYRGYGKAIWVSHGQALHWADQLYNRDIESLVATTHTLLPGQQ